MRTIYKYPVPEPGTDVIIAMHKGSKPVLVAQDPSGNWCVWLEVDDIQPTEPTRLFIVGTGHPIPRPAVHCGSFVQGPLVWHVYHG